MATRKPSTSSINLPPLQKGEHYAGILLQERKLAGAHHLILLPNESKSLTWQAAIDWAKEHNGELPDRREAALLWANLPAHFKQEWYWTATPDAGGSGLAWAQSFGYGRQDYWGKNYEFRARAVRRLAIKLFTHSIQEVLMDNPINNAPDNAISAAPQIGAAVAGGIYAGLTFHHNTPMHLVLLPEEIEDTTWQAAIDWAKEHNTELPSRVDALVLFQNLPDAFRPALYWTATPYAGISSYAWAQGFGYGDQDLWYKGNEFRARAVRRFSLTDSIIQ